MALSAEPGRKAAYDKDLRWRIIYQRIAIGMKGAEIAKNLNIAVSTAHRTYHYFERTGNVISASTTKKRYETAQRKMSKQNELFVLGVVLQIQQCSCMKFVMKSERFLELIFSPSSICRLLHSYGITRKKIRQIALQRSYSLCGAFRAQCSLFDPDMFVFVDETGVDHRHHIRRYGYALRGVRPEYTRPFYGHGQRINAIVGISTAGVTAVELTTSTVNRWVLIGIDALLASYKTLRFVCWPWRNARAYNPRNNAHSTFRFDDVSHPGYGVYNMVRHTVNVFT